MTVAYVDRVWRDVDRYVSRAARADLKLDWYHELSVCDDFELR